MKVNFSLEEKNSTFGNLTLSRYLEQIKFKNRLNVQTLLVLELKFRGCKHRKDRKYLIDEQAV